MQQWQKYLELYLKHKKSSKLSNRTIEDARYHVTNLFKGKSVDFSDFLSLKRLVIEYFADSDNINSVTFNTRRKNLNTFFNWMVTEEFLEKSPMKSIKKVREDRKPRHTTPEVVSKMLAACDINTYTGLRDYIVIALSFDTGIRPSEMEQLLYSDFDINNRQFTIRAEIAKTRTSRILPLNDRLIPLIKQLNQHHIKNSWNAKTPFFANENQVPLNRFSWRRQLAKYSGDEDISPYSLRHTAAISMLRNHANAFHVQNMLGHNNLNTTKIYINLATSDLKEVHAATSPLSKII